MSRLPEAVIRAWPENAMRDLGGWIELAGGDPQKHFSDTKVIKDHPWVGLTVIIDGVRAIVDECMTHPQGELMFDLTFERDVSWKRTYVPKETGELTFGRTEAYFLLTECEALVDSYGKVLPWHRPYLRVTAATLYHNAEVSND